MIDSHSHLFESEFDSDIEECIQRCKESNVNKIMLVGFSKETNQKAQDYSKRWDIFYPTAGIHPDEADSNYEEKLAYLDDFVKKNKVYAIGECGLDYHYEPEKAEIQKIIFEHQIRLAIDMNLPIIIHSRDAAKDTFDLVSKYKGKLKGVMHCYSGSVEMAKEYVKLGFYISLGGPVTFKNAKEPKVVAKEVDIHHLLVETDCPYMAPTPMRGKRNESSFVKYTLAEIANLRGMTIDELDEITTKNTEDLFQI